MMRVRAGYVPLTDAAVLIAAAEHGFAAAEGLDLELVRETSWANIRDKLVYGHFDAAHMLGPLAVATTLGLGHPAAPVIAPFALNRAGNAVTVSRDLAVALAAHGGLDGGLDAAARALGAVAKQRREPLTFGTVFPFSTHTYLLHALFAAAGLETDNDVRLTVIPPPFTVEALRRGFVDGFCCGSPWNSLAVDNGVGAILLLGNEILPRAPEKVLAIPAEMQSAPWLRPLLRALAAAAAWCADPANLPTLAERLSAPRHLDIPAEVIARTLNGRLLLDAEGRVRSDPAFLVLGGGAANRPGADFGPWLVDRMASAGHLPSGAAPNALAVFRPDLFDDAVA